MISINKQPSFTEIRKKINWHEGYVEHDEEIHRFWLIHPQGVDINDEEYELEVRWFLQRVPREVRAMHPLIINAFKQTLNDTGTK